MINKVAEHLRIVFGLSNVSTNQDFSIKKKKKNLSLLLAEAWETELWTLAPSSCLQQQKQQSRAADVPKMQQVLCSSQSLCYFPSIFSEATASPSGPL